ncbi:MAG TPA: hypothetical protein VLJ10_02310, partial [Candidatus Bathyarchaeia archaeon]|nr:hypothetical protein [Candidatus Bathyarchaeia archaeon]
MPQLKLEDLDFAKLNKIIKWLFLAVILMILWSVITWGRTFYTDWLWFSDLGHQQVLLKAVSTKIWLFLLGALIFLAVAVP